MERVLAIKDKYLSSTYNVEQVNEIIRSTATQLGRLKRDENERLFEEEKELVRLKEKITVEREQLSDEEQKINSMANELANHNELLKELELELNRLLVDNNEAELKRNKLKVVKPSTTDENILDRGRRKFDYYKVLTGIRWDYLMIDTSIKGFVTNDDNYIHPFSFDINDRRVESKLWREIEMSRNYCQIQKTEHKENSSPNL